VVEEGGDWSCLKGARGLVAAAGEALARHKRFEGEEPAEACVALSDDAAVRRLNAQYRGMDKATNVLSFPSRDSQFKDPNLPKSLGDVVIAQETVVREAAEQGIPAAHHLQHLVIHGLLHLIGFDHDRDEDAEDMESIEIDILSDLGISSPYSAGLEAAPSGTQQKGHGLLTNRT
jgi:probable rRNA maturation factor